MGKYQGMGVGGRHLGFAVSIIFPMWLSTASTGGTITGWVLGAWGLVCGFVCISYGSFNS